MPDLIDVVIKLAGALQRVRIRFALGGALANNYWGIVRSTLDVDCLIALPQIKYQMLADELNSVGGLLAENDAQFVPLTVVKMSEHVRQRKFIECSLDGARVELFVPAVPLQEELLRRAVSIQVRGSEIPITTAEDLVILKLVFRRPKDLDDVRGILWVQRGKLDLDYMRHWSARTLEADVQRELEQLIAKYSRDIG